MVISRRSSAGSTRMRNRASSVGSVAERQRWPKWVYGEGRDPDPRFTMANERTFLAWIRTALALLASGVALEALRLSWSEPVRRALAVFLVVLGILVAGAAWWRWGAGERALRDEESSSRTMALLGLLLSVGIAATGVVVLIAAL